MRDDQLTIEHEAPRIEGTDRRLHLGKVARQALAGPRLQLDVRAVPQRQAAKAVPFGLVLPALIARQLIDEPRLHRLEVPRDRGGSTSGCRHR